MKYTFLPSTDIKVSKICLGTMTFGNQNSEQEGCEQMDYAIDRGVNFFDTAELYPVPATAQLYADTEKIIGKYLWFFIFSHFNLKSNSKTQLINNPRSDRLIGNFPKLTLAAKHEIKNTYSFLCVIFLSKKLIIS